MNELRVELVRHEEVPRDEGNTADVKEWARKNQHRGRVPRR